MDDTEVKGKKSKLKKCYTCKTKPVPKDGEECETCWDLDLRGTSVKKYGQHIVGLDDGIYVKALR